MIAVSDEQILDMQRLLAKLEGIWVEPASAAGLAGLAQELANGTIDLKEKRVVAVCTGHGLKDPDVIAARLSKPLVLPPKLEALEAVILQ
jgi:threonine synthase